MSDSVLIPVFRRQERQRHRRLQRPLRADYLYGEKALQACGVGKGTINTLQNALLQTQRNGYVQFILTSYPRLLFVLSESPSLP